MLGDHCPAKRRDRCSQAPRSFGFLSVLLAFLLTTVSAVRAVSPRPPKVTHATPVVVVPAGNTSTNGTNGTNVTNPSVAPPAPPSRVPGRRYTLTYSPTATNPTATASHATLTSTVSSSVSPSLSISESGPVKPGALRWIRSDRKRAPRDFIPSIHDTELQTGAFVFTGILLHDEFVEVEDPWEMLEITLPLATVTQPRGLLGRKGQNSVLIKGKSFSYNTTYFTLMLFADAFFALRVEELVRISFRANITRKKLRPSEALELRITTDQFPRDDALVSLLTLQTLIASAALLLVGVPGSHHVQATVMIGQMACIDKKSATFASGTIPLLAPLPLVNDAPGRANGNMLLLLYVTGLYVATMLAIKSGVARLTAAELEERLSFPSLPFGLLVLLYPGFVFFSVRTLYAVVDGAMTVVLSLAFAFSLGGLYFVFRNIRGNKGFLSRLYFHTPPESWHVLFQARGRWGPHAVLTRFRCVIGELDASSEWFAFVPFVSSTVVGVIAGIEPTSKSQCQGYFGALALFFGVATLLYLGRRPYRYLPQNVFCALSCGSLIMITAGAARSDGLSPALFRNGILWQFSVVVVRGFYTLFTVLYETLRPAVVDEDDTGGAADSETEAALGAARLSRNALGDEMESVGEDSDYGRVDDRGGTNAALGGHNERMTSPTDQRGAPSPPRRGRR